MSAIEPAAPRDAVVVQPAAVVPARCKNCDAVLLGRFCVNCSQAANVHVPTTKELLHEMLEGITHSDSRLWRTLTTLWFKPGKLTEEFVAGRRVAYLPPFRLYLVLSIIFFLLLSFMHTSVEFLNLDDTLKPASPPAGAAAPAAKPLNSCADVNFDFPQHPTWNPRIKHACEVLRDSDANMVHLAVATMSKAMFIFLPLIAFLNMLLYWRPRYRYAEQLLFFVHLHAFYFSVAIVMLAVINAADAWPSLGGVAGFLETILGWTLPVYTVLGMRRLFRRSWPGILFKGAVLFFVYMIVFGLTVAGAVVYAAFQL
jgi:Protein of unknown function (DUF3667)